MAIEDNRSRSGHLNWHIHMPHLHFHHHNHGKRVPKGCLAVTVGKGEEQQKFVIPVMYLNHPLFVQLLKNAEEEYGFNQKGPINIPCRVEEFCQVRSLIDKETSMTTTTTVHQHQQHHHLQLHHYLCFKA